MKRPSDASCRFDGFTLAAVGQLKKPRHPHLRFRDRQWESRGRWANQTPLEGLIIRQHPALLRGRVGFQHGCVAANR